MAIEDNDAEAGYAFIGAVHDLLASARSHQKADLLLAAVMQALYEADRDFAEVVRRVGQIWPGAVLSEADVQMALELGSELRLVARTETLASGDVWTLTKNGVDDVRQHAQWVTELRERACEDVQERAASGLMTELNTDQAEALLDHLVRALGTAIRASQAPYTGQIDALLHTGRANQRVAPRHLDRDELLRAVGQSGDPAIDFVRSLALAAVDPLDPFGNELVSHITTGCILYAFVAGVDRQKLMRRIGSPTGQRAVLDTPLLVDLLGPRRVACSLEATIRSAVVGGWEVIALDHSVEEAAEVLHRDVPGIAKTLVDVLQDGTQQAWYASLADGQLPSLCVEALRDGTYSNLDQLIAAVDDLPARLEVLGVVVRPHGNQEPEMVSVLRESLRAELGERSHRSDVVLQRDAETMTVVWRCRQRKQSSQWPGGWVITKDRYMAPAYAKADLRDKVALTLTGAQWATLLSVSVDPVAVESLARAAAAQIMDEAAWTLPVRYPPHIAVELARQLSPEQGGSDTDIRVAQMTLDDALVDSQTGAGVASTVLAERARRINALAETDKQRLAERLAAARRSAEDARADADKAHIRRLEGEQQNRRAFDRQP